MAKKKKENLIEEKIVEKQDINLDAIKEELFEYVDEKVNDKFTNEIDKANKRLIREKNKKIIWRNIVIMGLIGVIGFLLYVIYHNGYFNHYLNKEENKQSIVDTEKKEVVDSKPSLTELKKTYGYLLDKIIISNECSYLQDYYNGNLTDELKKYIALNSMDFDKLDKEDDYNIISSNDLDNAYNKLFNDKMNHNTFDYNGNKVRYISSLNAYLTEKKLLKKNEMIIRNIGQIETKDNMVIITTYEGLLKENILYNILTDNEIGEYDVGKLSDYALKMNKLTYTFVDGKLNSLK